MMSWDNSYPPKRCIKKREEKKCIMPLTNASEREREKENLHKNSKHFNFSCEIERRTKQIIHAHTYSHFQIRNNSNICLEEKNSPIERHFMPLYAIGYRIHASSFAYT